jgi:hypothetical protein
VIGVFVRLGAGQGARDEGITVFRLPVAGLAVIVLLAGDGRDGRRHRRSRRAARLDLLLAVVTE